jgi:diguanylate cyclase (GGDEF)-like protein
MVRQATRIRHRVSTSAISRQLRHQSHVDIADRASGGLGVHLPLWLLVGWYTGVLERVPGVYLAVAGMFAVLMGLRLLFERRLASLAADRPAAYWAFHLLLMTNPLAWGVITSLTMLWAPMAPARELMWLVVISVVSSGGIVFAIDSRLRLGYSLAPMLPGVAAAVVTGHELATFLVVGTVLMQVFLVRAAHIVHSDYWAAATARAELEQRALVLEQQSITDSMTQVSNRQHFDRQMALEWARAERDGTPLSLLMIDVDHFKRINDEHGHPVGDQCLKLIAQCLAQQLRGAGDLLARYGGEEFVALLPGAQGEAAASSAERLRAAVAVLRVPGVTQGGGISCSIGVHTAWPARGGSAAELVAGADAALYAAKDAGRNQICIFPAPGPGGGPGRAVPRDVPIIMAG